MNVYNTISLRMLAVAAVTSSLALQPTGLTHAANHSLSSIKDTHIIHLTANVDWNYDGPAPMQLGTTGVVLTKTVIEEKVLRETARSIFLMTEGKHRVGNIYVYKNSKYGNNVDIRLLNQTGRSNAHLASWQVNAGRSANFLSIESEDEKKKKYIYSYPLGDYGKVIAHEMGHYIYAVLDEYAGSEADTKYGPSFPNLGDNVRSTIMNDSSLFTRFSVAGDYPGNGENRTAQARIYGNPAKALSAGSQWEMLVTDPRNDTTAAKKDHLGNRKWFEAFKGFAAPRNYTDLDKFFGVWCPTPRPALLPGQVDECLDGGKNYQGTPSDRRITDGNVYWSKLYLASGGSALADAADGGKGGAFENFKVVWMDSPSDAALARTAVVTDRAMPQAAVKEAMAVSVTAVARDALLIDRTMPQAAFKEAIAAAVAEVQSRMDNSQLAIVVSPSDSALPVFPLKPVASNKQEMIKALLSIARKDGVFDITKGYEQIDALVNKGRADVDSSSIFLMTDAGREAVISAGLGKDAREKSNAFNIIRFDGPLLGKGYEAAPEYARRLYELALATGGEFATADSSQKAAKAVRNMSQGATGMRTSFLASSSYLPSAGAHRESIPFKASKYDDTLSAEWFFDPDDRSRLGFSLVSPAGAVYNKIDPESNPDEGYVLIKVSNADGAKIGNWRVETSYSGPTSETVEVEVSTESAVELNPSMSGGSKSDGRAPVLRAIFGGDSPIIGAKVMANIYRTHDLALVLSGLELKDDGLGVDARPNDGSYAIDLSGLLFAGDYWVEITAETNDGSVFSTNLPFALGQPAPEVAVGAGVVRVETVDFSLEEGAPGVLFASSRSSGGGCTVSNGPADAGLIGLLLVAVMGLGLRRRKSPRAD
ncbi:MAG: MYXO-CTERM sorting domain-containing protein [Rhodoferax sp.]